MFQIIHKDEKRYLIQSPQYFYVIPTPTFEIVKNRKIALRNPVIVTIDSKHFVFTQSEWKKCEDATARYNKFTSGIPEGYRKDLEESRQKSPRQMKQRNTRAVNEANAVGELRKRSFESYWK